MRQTALTAAVVLLLSILAFFAGKTAGFRISHYIQSALSQQGERQ